jgi:hypothetical protein
MQHRYTQLRKKARKAARRLYPGTVLMTACTSPPLGHGIEQVVRRRATTPP